MERLFLVLCAALLACVLAVSAQAQADRTSVTRVLYDRCMQNARKAGVAQAGVYVAWASGMSHTCLVSQSPPAEARPFVLAQCERSMADLRRLFRVRDKCRLVVDRGRIADKTYRRALSPTRPIAVQLTIFDHVTGKRQVVKGAFADYPLRFRGPELVESGFVMRAGKTPLCQGRYRTSPASLTLRYSAICFGMEFKGTTKPNRLLRHDGMAYVVPEKVRLEQGRSWIEMQF